MSIESLLRRQPTAGQALFVDMNSFFASIEQEVDPGLRGRPVGVCPFINDATCVIAASVEAKRFGVKTGTSVRRAKELCPAIKLVTGNAPLYRDYHRRIMARLDQTRCRVSIKSIDEALLTVPGDRVRQALRVGHEVKEAVRQVGSQLKCSVGISSNMFLAKMGTNIQKPDGLIEIKPDDLEAFYSILELTDLHGISWRMARRLHDIGISTPLAFYRAPFELLKKTFGINGERWYLRLRGYEVDQIKTTRRMIGHQNTITPQPATSRDQVLSVASQLVYKAAVRLRASELAARNVAVYVRFTDRTYWGKSLRTHSPFFDSRTFFAHVASLLEGWQPPKPVRLVSVTSSDLVPFASLSGSLFDPPYRFERLSEALDIIEHKFGRHTIVPAASLLSHRVVDQVGFGNAPHTAATLNFG